METGPTHKSLATLGLMALVILAPASVFTVTGDAPQVLLLTVLGLVASGAVRKPLARNTRTFVYTGLSAIVLAVLSEQLFPVDPNRFFFLVPSHVLCPPILYLAVAITFLDQRDSNVSGVIGLALLALMISGNCIGFQVTHRHLSLPLRAERYLHLFYGVAVAVQLTACVCLMARAPHLVRQRASGSRRLGLRLAITVGLLALTVVGTLLLRGTGRYLESFGQNLFAQFFQMHRGHGGRVVFGRDVDLWRTVPHLSTADNTIVLRALSAAAPGYLRGRAYTQYSGGHWSAASPDRPLPFTQPGGRLTYSVFTRAPPAGASPALATRRIDVYPSRGFRSDVLFAPGAATTFEVVAESLGHNNDGELSPSEWDPRVGYTTVAPDTTADEAYYGPVDATHSADAYLALPDNLCGPLAALAATVFADAQRGDARSTVVALTRFFERSFRYELGTSPGPEAVDPILPFLLQRRSGHCELFATATVLLLRQQGVRARYVTGLVCQERAMAGQWLARLCDVHAWAEAYDSDRAQWVRVETTPAAGIPQALVRAGFAERGFGQLSFAWQHVIALMKRGAVAQAIVAALNGLGHSLGWLLLSPVGAPLTVLLTVLLVRRWRQHRARSQGAEELPTPRIRLRGPYLEVLSNLRRLLPELPPQPTPQALAHGVRKRLPETAAPILASALERYQQLRYGSELPRDEEIAALATQFRAGLRELRRTLAAGRRQDPG